MRCRVQVKVMLRVCSTPVDAAGGRGAGGGGGGGGSCLSCSEHLSQVTLHDHGSAVAGALASPATPRQARRPAASAPRTFAFDAVFTQDTPLVSITVHYC